MCCAFAGDVAEHVLHLAAEAEPDRDSIDLIDRFGYVGHFFKDDFAEGEGEREVGDAAIIRLRGIRAVADRADIAC